MEKAAWYCILSAFSFQNKVDDINELLKSNAERYAYKFIDNGNILAKKHLWRDKLHLNTDGLKVLANNFIDCLNDAYCKY